MLETTDGGKELVDALVSIARGVMPNVPVQEGSRPRKDQQVRPADQLKAIEILLDRGFGRSPQQLMDSTGFLIRLLMIMKLERCLECENGPAHLVR